MTSASGVFKIVGNGVGKGVQFLVAYLQFFGTLTQVVKEASVFDGDGRRRSQGLGQHLVVGRVATVAIVDEFEHANDLVARPQRHGHERADRVLQLAVAQA